MFTGLPGFGIDLGTGRQGQLIVQDDADREPTATLYDVRELPGYLQTGPMRVQGRWLATTYDEYGRPRYVGFATDTAGVNTGMANITDTLIWNVVFMFPNIPLSFHHYKQNHQRLYHHPESQAYFNFHGHILVFTFFSVPYVFHCAENQAL